MKNFFQSEQCTEFYTENGEIWVFGDTPENITEDTPNVFVRRESCWGDGSEEEAELLITDGHGQRELVKGKIYVAEKYELIGSFAEEVIRKWYNFND